MAYDRPAVAAYFDQLAEGEWRRFEKAALGAIHEHIHNLYLERFVLRGSRVLEIGAGPGRFTQTLHRLGCRIVVADISDVQLGLNRRYGSENGFASSVEAYEKLDICDLTALPNASFDVVVAYGGPLSYVFERRDDAVESCRRVLKPGGVLLASVMSLWGTLHRHLAALKDLPLWSTKNIVETGDLTPENDPTSPHKCHLFRSAELAISWSVTDSPSRRWRRRTRSARIWSRCCSSYASNRIAGRHCSTSRPRRRHNPATSMGEHT